MAYKLSFWEAAGRNGEAQLAEVRIPSIKAPLVLDEIERAKRDSKCVRVTLERTDGQGPKAHGGIVRDLWLRPGYTDPFA